MAGCNPRRQTLQDSGTSLPGWGSAWKYPCSSSCLSVHSMPMSTKSMMSRPAASILGLSVSFTPSIHSMHSTLHKVGCIKRILCRFAGPAHQSILHRIECVQCRCCCCCCCCCCHCFHLHHHYDYHEPIGIPVIKGLTCLRWRSSEYRVRVSWAHVHTAWQTSHSCGLPGCNPARQTAAWQTHPPAAPEVVISAATYTALMLFFSPMSAGWLALQPMANLHQRL